LGPIAGLDAVAKRKKVPSLSLPGTVCGYTAAYIPQFHITHTHTHVGSLSHAYYARFT